MRGLLCAVSALLLAIVARATIDATLQTQLGNPTNATSDPANHSHYLISRPQYGLDYDDSTREPNWVSWDLTSTDIGSSGRSDFIQDTTLPAGFYQVLTTDYSGSGYDRGHMCPSADRTVTAADNQQLFYMSNMVPQAPDNNQGIWANFETYCRTLASAGNELLITCGPSGFGGSTIASGVAIPGYTWKVVVVVPLGSGSAVSRITSSTRVIAIKVPNIAGVRNTPWETFVTSAAQIETDTGYTFFTNLPASVASTLRTVVDGQVATGTPAITTQPAGQTSAVGSTATFSVLATGDAPLSYQWLKNDTEIAGATNSTLTISNAQAGDAATYTVVVSNAVGSVTSNGADLVITGLPPTISDQPVSRTVAAGSTVSFAVTAAGSPPFTYQWRKAGMALTDGGNVSGATAPTLTLQNVQADDMANYDVIVTNAVNSIVSNSANLTVTPAAPTIISQPVNRSLAPGSTATFAVVATGTTPLSYQWRKGGAPILGNASALTATLTLVGISASDAGSYDVVVTNSVDATTSSAATLSLTNASTNQVFYTGGNYVQDFDTLPSSGTFAVSGSGPNVPVYLSASPINASNLGGWSFAQTLTSGTTRFVIGTGSGNTGSTYSFGSSASTDRALGLLNSSTNLSVFGVTIVNNTGQTITSLSLGYTGEQWRWGGSTGDKLSVEYQIGGSDVVTGAFTSIPVLDFTSPVQSGTSGALDGNNSNNRRALSTTLAGITWAPGQTIVIRWKQFRTTSADGLGVDNFSFSTAVSGPVGPSVASTVPAALASNVALNTTIAVTFDQMVNASGSSFLIESAKRGAIAAAVSASVDGKTYTLTPPSNFDYSDTVAVKVFAAGITSQSTGLHPASDYSFSFVTADPVAPTITSQPVAQTVAAGSTASFTVAASGSAPFSYQWRKDGTPISGNPSAGSATLVLTNVQAADIGNYDVIVSNGVNPSATSSAASLGVTPAAPSITTPPAAQTVTEGDTVTLSVVVGGTMPFTFQWQRNGVNVTDGTGISGSNTATLIFSSIVAANGGTYTVIITNGVGSPVTSTPVVLTVNVPAKPFTPGNLVVVRVGSGTGSLVNTGNPVFLDEYTTDGALVRSIDLPASASGANKPFVIGGTATTEGELTRSADRRFLTLVGYATAPGGSTSLSGSNSTAINRVVARVGIDGTVDTSTALADWTSGASPRSGVTADGTSFWVAGGNSGVRLAALGATSSTSISTTTTNLRMVDIYGGQLYISTQSGSSMRIAAVGTGLPTTGSATMTTLPGYPTSGGSPYGFFFADLDATVPGVDTLYVADDGATGGILKYSLVNGVWTANGTITASGVRGITGTINSGVVTLFATTGASSATGGGSLYKVTDATGYNGAVSGAAAVIATAATNTAFRGVAFAPGNAPTISDQPAPQAATFGDTVSFTVKATGSSPLSYHWRKGGVLLNDGGSVSGATTAQLTVTSVSAADAGAYDVIVANPIDSVTSNVAALSYTKAPATITLGDLNVTYDGAAHAASATTAPGGLKVVFTYDGDSTTPVNAGSYAVVATLDDANFSGSTTGTLVIAKASASVALGGLAQVYDGTARIVTPATTPAGLTVDVTYDGSATPPVNAGSYVVLATVNDANYTGGATGTLIVAKAPAVVSLGSLSAIYNGNPHAATATTAPAGLPVVLTYDGGLTPPTNAGTYAVLATINDANYTGSAAGSLIITPATATITLSNLVHAYDGTPKSATVTTSPDTLKVVVTYQGSTSAPTAPGAYAVVATIQDANYAGTADGTLVITTTALVRHAPRVSGGVDGSVQLLTGDDVTLNGNAWISGDLLVPGTPTLQLNGLPVIAGTIDDDGAADPSNYTVTLGGSSMLRYLVRRTDPLVLNAVDAPAAPTGTRNVVLTSAAQTPGDFATLRNLTLSGSAGLVAVPPGTYGVFNAMGNTGFVFGVPGSTQPAVYNLQNLGVNVLPGNAQIQVVGPVLIVLANGTIINGTSGSAEHPHWLNLRFANGGLTISGNSVFHGDVTAPNGTITLNGNATLDGTVVSDRLTINGTSVLKDPDL